MTQIYVKPSPGGRIRMPERNYVPMPATGAWIGRGDYYERLLIGGDVVECEPPVAEEPAAAPEPDEPPSEPDHDPETPDVA